MYILVVEDDYLQADWLALYLGRAFAGCKINRIATESEFRERFEMICSEPPDIIVMDMMLRWADAGPNIPPRDEEVTREGLNRAGKRCVQLLATNKQTSNIPVILYTVLEPADLVYDEQTLAPNVVYLRKESDLSPLIDIIRQRTRSNPARSGPP